MQSQSNTKRIAKNTIMLYFRQILIMLVSLYTVRVVLNVLGSEDYGIYTVVAGVVTMFSFLSNAMATASQRYFSFDLGKGDTEHLKTTFSVTFQIYVLLALLVVLLAETLGLWFVNHKLVIPPERMLAANWIFQAAIFSFLLTLITTPYMASIIAHEDMKVYAYVSIVEAGLKLGIVFLLRIIPTDKLIMYGLLLAGVSFINTSCYRLYCHRHYEECNFRLIKDGILFKDIVGYSGWNLFGSLSLVLKKQVTNIILNIYFGVVVNAARGIASQVNTAVASLAQNFTTAIKPQIVKKYASNQKEESIQTVFKSCKFTFFLMYLFSFPLIVEMNSVLSIWLNVPPADAVIFSRLALVEALIDSVSYSIMTLSQATGKIKLYQSVVGGVLLLNLPISWIVLHFGAPAYSVMIVTIIICCINFFVRIIIVHFTAGFSILQFIMKTVMPCLLVGLLASVLPIFFHVFFVKNTILSIANIFVSVITTCLIVVFLGMNKSERKFLLEIIKKKGMAK